MKNWPSLLTSFSVGVLFAIGLVISGMTDPSKVIGFLDVFGGWDSSLLFVMGGAVGVHFVLYRLARKRSTPLFSGVWHIPNKKEITPSLVIGSLLFGLGWGVAGYCPGPAWVSLMSFQVEPLIFVLSMVVGMWLFKLLDRFRKQE